MRTVLAVLDHYKEAVYKQDVIMFMSLYDPKAFIYDSWLNWSVNSLAEWQKSIESWFDTLKRDRSTIHVSYEDLVVEENENLAYVHTGIRYSEYNSNKIEFRHLTNRFTIILKQDEKGWRIIHEHSSLPINPDNGKAIFDLK